MDVENVAVARPGGLTVFENSVKFRLLGSMGIAWTCRVLRLSVIHKKSTDARVSLGLPLTSLGLSPNCSEPHFMWEMAVVILAFGNCAAKCI